MYTFWVHYLTFNLLKHFQLNFTQYFIRLQWFIVTYMSYINYNPLYTLPIPPTFLPIIVAHPLVVFFIFNFLIIIFLILLLFVDILGNYFSYKTVYIDKTLWWSSIRVTSRRLCRFHMVQRVTCDPPRHIIFEVRFIPINNC